ncbi:thiamine biosynthesis lipoprotein [Methanohalophilus levihalophilus]|uniref:FAD:protein FMN transferase n=1 Tax=Methanohalophilus levihalophilus TaxID=1431282 RepID=UPI001AE99E59|nr:FAD:protein FMN transferase [Methanohalophilus levihalophilus]MBP2030877.1 thiamine biosynthesis lipoprotein [Methanohalophilus levihalophilus]
MDTKIVTVFIILILASIAFVGFDSDSGTPVKMETYSQTREALGTTITIAAVGADEEQAYEAIDKAFVRISEIESLMSTYESQSQVSTLNQDKTIENVDPSFVFVLEEAIYYSEITDGAFDVTIKPVLDLWASKFGEGRPNQPPTQEELDTILPLVNSSAITINETSISIEEGMQITLGGIAKGYAVDEAARVLMDEGFKSGFVNAGGDGFFFGTKPDGETWIIGLQDPEKKAEPVTLMSVSGKAVTTSGNYERYFNDSARVSHIADPRTGYTVSNLISSTIIADSAIEADALATSVFVLGEEDGLELIESLEGVECLIITPDKRIVKSEGFEAYEIQ